MVNATWTERSKGSRLRWYLEVCFLRVGFKQIGVGSGCFIGLGGVQRTFLRIDVAMQLMFMFIWGHVLSCKSPHFAPGCGGSSPGRISSGFSGACSSPCWLLGRTGSQAHVHVVVRAGRLV